MKEYQRGITLPFRAMGRAAGPTAASGLCGMTPALVFEVKVRVKPETEGQGVRARLHFYALDSGRTGDRKLGGPRPWTLPWTGARSMRSGILSIRPSGNMELQIDGNHRPEGGWLAGDVKRDPEGSDLPPVTTAPSRRDGDRAGAPEYAGQLYGLTLPRVRTRVSGKN